MCRPAPIVRAAMLAAGLVVAGRAAAADDLSRYLRLDATSGRVLVQDAPTATSAREDALTASKGATVTFGPFTTEPATVASRLGAGPISFAAFLATGAAGMPGCAEVAVTLAKVPASGPEAPLATAHFTTSIVPRASLVDPIAGLVPISGPVGVRSLALGDALAFTIAVTNRCTDGAHTVRLLYDAVDRASRIAFTDDCPGVDNPDQIDTDDDGIGDACDVCPTIPDDVQIDRDGDGIGDLCDDCPLVADPEQSDDDGDGVGSACDACPDVAGAPGEAAGCPCAGVDCDDEDPCTVDSCTDTVGCDHERMVELAFIECRLLFLRDIVRGASDVDPKIEQPRSPVRRSLKQAGRSLLRAERARRKRAQRYAFRAADLARRLQIFVAKIRDAKRAGRLPAAFYDRLIVLAGEAIEAIPDP